MRKMDKGNLEMVNKMAENEEDKNNDENEEEEEKVAARFSL